ncbi:Uncharacterized protein HZ326_18935 [Fusarium oxysporum f. sp. albedinis]|nr:Uncharacterized protein HZ326_18935 [Fusarium oxysporum f. sp. albedinis]
MAVYVWAGADSCLAYYWIHLLSSYPGFPPTDLSIPPPLYVSPGDLTLFLSDGSFTCWRKGGLEIMATCMNLKKVPVQPSLLIRRLGTTSVKTCM